MYKIASKFSPITLIVLDGWGVAPASKGNAISLANTPNFDALVSKYKTITLRASGEAIGLLNGQAGNSELNHLNLGAGRIVNQPLSEINRAIENKNFKNNLVFKNGLANLKKYKTKLHLLGLISENQELSSLNHLYALLDLAKEENIAEVCLHLILDDHNPNKKNALQLVSEIKEKINNSAIARISSLSGRNYALDSHSHWDKIQKAYEAIYDGKSDKIFSDSFKAISSFYEKDILDEDLPPIVIGPGDKIEKNDVLIFFNFNPKGTQELGQALIDKNFDKFVRPRFEENLFFITLTKYSNQFDAKIAFPFETMKFTLAEIISRAGLKQLHLAETEKYASVTYFLNGKRNEPFSNEDDLMMPSLNISSYGQKPSMSAMKLAKKAANFILEKKYDFVVLNLANPDILGHTGNIDACIKGIETADRALGILIEIISSQGQRAIILGDHGCVEEMINLHSNEIDRENSLNSVPMIFMGTEWRREEIFSRPPDLSLSKPEGILADVAPTILKIIGLSIPKEMTGKTLI